MAGRIEYDEWGRFVIVHETSVAAEKAVRDACVENHNARNFGSSDPWCSARVAARAAGTSTAAALISHAGRSCRIVQPPREMESAGEAASLRVAVLKSATRDVATGRSCGQGRLGREILHQHQNSTTKGDRTIKASDAMN